MAASLVFYVLNHLFLLNRLVIFVESRLVLVESRGFIAESRGFYLLNRGILVAESKDFSC